MKTLTAGEKMILSEILRRVLTNCDYDEDSELYTTNESLLITFDKKVLNELRVINKKLN